MLLADTHFGHRASAGIVVDLFWSHGDPGDRFRVEVQDARRRPVRSLPGDGAGSDPRLPPPVRIGARPEPPAEASPRRRAAA